MLRHNQLQIDALLSALVHSAQICECWLEPHDWHRHVSNRGTLKMAFVLLVSHTNLKKGTQRTKSTAPKACRPD